MSKVVFILGAGASKHSGAPVMRDFLDVASDLYASGKVSESKEAFERVFSARSHLQLVHSKARLDLNNIESIFTVLELGKVIRKVPGLQEDEIESTIRALKILIVKTLESNILFRIKQNDGKGTLVPDRHYARFANMMMEIRRKKELSISVITFNYDIGLDIAMELSGVRPNYIIETLGYEGHDEHGMELMKLHGSLNWAITKDQKKILAFPLLKCLPSYGKIIKNTTLPIGTSIQNQCKNHFNEDVDHEPVIVPPSWNKADYHSIVSPVWAAAAKNLSEAEHIFIIGYSLPLTDSFFRHLYALGSAGESLIRSIVVFDPDVSVQQRFLDLIGPGAEDRYEYKAMNFESCIDIIRERLSLETAR